MSGKQAGARGGERGSGSAHPNQRRLEGPIADSLFSSLFINISPSQSRRRPWGGREWRLPAEADQIARAFAW